MRKFLAVVKREYLKLVWTWTFLIGTLVAPLFTIGSAIVPTLMFSIEGAPTRIAVVDQSGRLYENVRAELAAERRAARDAEQNPTEALQNPNAAQQQQIRNATERARARFVIEEFRDENRSTEQIRREMNGRLQEQTLDAYLIIPADFERGNYEYYARNTSDIVAQGNVENALNEAVRRTRLANNNISEQQLDQINRKVNVKSVRVSDSGEAEDSGGSFIVVFFFALLIYIVLIIYGQQILAAVVEEKETRIAEILFSSARPFQLMMGKLVGVSLVALTQLAIWVASAAVLAVYLAAGVAASGISFSIPTITPLFVALLFVFFLLGFFTYATIYALIGSMVTTVQEGGQFSTLPILLLMTSLYCAFPVIRSPNSELALWTSLLPFISPIVMPVRMAIQMPPLWQVALAILSSVLTILALVWVAARAYRVGMLMYGKRATIPEVFRWIRQS